MATQTIIKDIKDEKMEATIKELKEYKILQKQVEDKIKEAEAVVKQYMKDIGEDNIAIGQYTCKLTEVVRDTFDKEVVRKNAPKLFEKASGTSSYIRLLIK
jgi:predicted phage-related endonuclease